MKPSFQSSRRAVVPALSTILMVAVTILIAATLSVFVLDVGEGVDESGPSGSFEGELTTDSNGNEALRVTLTQGGPIEAAQLMLIATEPVDLGGTGTPPNSGYATTGEKLTEGKDQTGVGEELEVGESFLVGGTDLDGVTIRLVWNPREIDKDDQGGRAPSAVVGENSKVLWEYTVEDG